MPGESRWGSQVDAALLLRTDELLGKAADASCALGTGQQNHQEAVGRGRSCLFALKQFGKDLLPIKVAQRKMEPDTTRLDTAVTSFGKLSTRFYANPTSGAG
ncbi:hypothetical protein WJX73_002347 [Symbiochloris irregularis]|uniref:Uncharacterized protein n=1 Tax=Symbiochloris irregularis TaxID=706552 RepID=A0AAW1P2P8_9CHLO